MLAASDPDSIAEQIVTFYRLLAPGGGSLAEILAFQTAHPDWPMTGTLARHRDVALAQTVDDDELRIACQSLRAGNPTAIARCTTPSDDRDGAAAALAHQAWPQLPADPAVENAFLQRWGSQLTAADHWRRFDRLWQLDEAAALRQVPRLDDRRKLAMARLAVRHDARNAVKLVAALPPDQRGDAGLLFEQARALRRADQDEAALALWRDRLTPAQALLPPETARALWAERNQLARRRLQSGDATGAYSLAASGLQTDPESAAEADFLAGWIALRRLHDPATALRHFTILATLSNAAITQGRAHYWLGRSHDALGDPQGAQREFAQAANWPTTYYGQLAALTLDPGERALAAQIANEHDPVADPDRILRFAGTPLMRAALRLFAWGEPHRARAFLSRAAEIDPDPVDKTVAARIATALGLPDEAVAIARLAGRNGIILPESGWPMPYLPQDADPALTLAVARQESSFDADAASPVGARGLMQLMPATAQIVARQISAPEPADRLTDPVTNLRLGAAYLRQLRTRFTTIPFALAAYNAGPGRVRGWLAQPDGGANTGANAGVGAGVTKPDMIDWIEMIPFSETRNYVQRVIENLIIYRARRGDTAPHPLG